MSANPILSAQGRARWFPLFAHVVLSFLLLFGHLCLSGQTDNPKPSTAPKEIYMKDFMQNAQEYFQHHTGGYKQYKRVEEYMLNRLGDDGRIVNSTALNYQAYLSLKSASGDRMPDANTGNWSFLGPYATNTGNGIKGQGRVNRFAFHPTDPNIVYAATAGGGLWKTTNQGNSWIPLSDGLPVMNTSGVAVDFEEPNTLYLLTGDGDGQGSFYGFNEFTRASVGVFKSTNGGALWQPTGLMFNETSTVLAYNLSMSPGDRLRLYACTTDGLYRTDDGGDTWTLVRAGRIYEMEFKPGDPDRIYCVNNTWVYVSTDGGDTWSDSTAIDAIDGRVGRMTITTAPSNPDLVYVLATPIDTFSETDTLPDHRGIWRSTNSGEDFELISTRPNLLAGTGGNEFKTQAWYDIALECNPADDNHIIVGTIGIWYSTDGGETMETYHGINSMYHADIHDIKFNPLDSLMYVATDGGVWVSDDLGQSYTFRSGSLAITQYYRIATSPFDSDLVFAGSQDNGVHRRDDASTTLDRVVWGDGMETIFHPLVDSFVLSSVQEGEIHRSLDGGNTFSHLVGPFKGGDTAQWTTPMALDAYDSNIIYLGYFPIWKSTDGGETFAPIADSISGHRILETNRSNSNRVYAGDCKTCSEGLTRFELYVSGNAAESWTRIDTNDGFPNNRFISDATINPDNSLEIWITCGRYSAANKVFKSTNGGSSWTNMTGSLPNVPVNAIAYEDNDGSPSGAVYIATDIGVFYRNDDLGDWIHFSNNLPAVEVTDIAIDYNGRYIRASTYGRGMWQSGLYADCVDEILLNTSNQKIGRSYEHHANDLIRSRAEVDGAGSRVVYQCGYEVLLVPGFSARGQNGAMFHAHIAPCDEGGIVDDIAGSTESIKD